MKLVNLFKLFTSFLEDASKWGEIRIEKIDKNKQDQKLHMLRYLSFNATTHFRLK